MRDDNQEETTPQDALPSGALSLDEAIAMMRTDVAVRADWRQSLLRDVAASPRPAADHSGDVATRTSPRIFSVRPLVALAACALAMVTGSVGTMLVMNRADTGTPSDAAEGVASAQVVQSAVGINASGTHLKVIRFALVAPGAKTVSLVGDFNGWNAKSTPLAVGKDGTTWLVEMPLSNGRHVYAFVVDGDIISDPSAARVVDHDFGGQNSVVLVGDS